MIERLRLNDGIIIWLCMACFFLSACNATTMSVKETATIASQSELVDVSTSGLLDDPEEIDAVTVYQSFLEGNISYYDHDMENFTTIAPCDGGKYSMTDMTGDGIPELITTQIVRQYRDSNSDVIATLYASGIFSYKNGEIILWYDGLSHDFEILENDAILFNYSMPDSRNYFDYIELNECGHVTFEIHGIKYKNPLNSEWQYMINDTDVEMEEWYSTISPYLEIQQKDINWYDYSQLSN